MNDWNAINLALVYMIGKVVGFLFCYIMFALPRESGK